MKHFENETHDVVRAIQFQSNVYDNIKYDKTIIRQQCAIFWS